jgi:hypothetical protein
MGMISAAAGAACEAAGRPLLHALLDLGGQPRLHVVNRRQVQRA